MKYIKSFFILSIISLQVYGQSKIEIKNPWVRPAAQGSNSALYFVIENKENKADTLISAEFKLAGVVEIHETYKKDNDRMGMRAVDFIAVPAKSKVELKPGGLHVMLIDLQQDLKIDDHVEAELIFKHEGKLKIKAKVLDAPSKHSMMH